jgi:Histidine kinase
VSASLHETPNKPSADLPEAGQFPTEAGPSGDEAVDDRWARRFGILGFGIVIPNATGLFGPYGVEHVAYWLAYVWFIGLAWVIWSGNRWLLFRQREHLDWFSRPAQKVVVLLFAIVCFTAPATLLGLLAWYRGAGIPVDPIALRTTTLTNVICVVFVTHVYETVFLIKERSGDMLRIERIDKARAQAQLDALRAQIDPHFLFNSLNTLCYLIEDSPDRARAYTETLARVYRYILMHRDRDLVLLRDELALLDDYFFLLELRFGDALELRYLGRDDRTDALLAIPMSLQSLVENAVKHNLFSRRRPLVIEVTIEDDSVTVSHPMRPKEIQGSSKVGLSNLGRRHELVLGTPIRIAKDERFSVTVQAVKAA